MKVTAEKAKKGAKRGVAQGVSTIFGLIVGKLAMNLATNNLKVPAWVSPTLGLLGFAPHILSDNENAQAFGNGIIAAGGIDGLQKLTAGKPGIMGKANAYLPALNSATIVVAPAPAATNGFGNPDYAQMLLNGIGNSPSPTMAESLVM